MPVMLSVPRAFCPGRRHGGLRTFLFEKAEVPSEAAVYCLSWGLRLWAILVFFGCF